MTKQLITHLLLTYIIFTDVVNVTDVNFSCNYKYFFFSIQNAFFRQHGLSTEDTAAKYKG